MDEVGRRLNAMLENIQYIHDMHHKPGHRLEALERAKLIEADAKAIQNQLSDHPQEELGDYLLSKFGGNSE